MCYIMCQKLEVKCEAYVNICVPRICMNSPFGLGDFPTANLSLWGFQLVQAAFKNKIGICNFLIFWEVLMFTLSISIHCNEK